MANSFGLDRELPSDVLRAFRLEERLSQADWVRRSSIAKAGRTEH